jgi:hypothetical protein
VRDGFWNKYVARFPRSICFSSSTSIKNLTLILKTHLYHTNISTTNTYTHTHNQHSRSSHTHTHTYIHTHTHVSLHSALHTSPSHSNVASNVNNSTINQMNNYMNMESAEEALLSSKSLEGKPWEQWEFDMLKPYCVSPSNGHQNPQSTPNINNIQSMATPSMPMPCSTYNFIQPQNNTFEAPFLQYQPIYNMQEAAPACCMQQNMPAQKGFFQLAFTQYGDPDTIMTDAPISDTFLETQEGEDFFNFNTLPPQPSAPAAPLVFNQPYLPVYDLEIQLDIPAPNLPTPPPPQPQPPQPQPQLVAQIPSQSANDRKRKRQSHQTAQVARQPKPVQKCQDCPYSNSNMQEFNRHVNSVHQGIRNHPCGICGTPYNDASSLAKHKKSAKHKKRMRDLGIPLPDEVMFECPECRAHGRQRRFGRPDQLQRHLQKCKHTNGVLPAGFRSGVGGMDRGRVRL